MSGSNSVPAEVKAILAAAGGGTPVRPNTPVLPLESAYATATFIDPSTNIITGKRMTIGQKDYIAPNVTLNAKKGLIVIGSSSTIQDDAQLIANPSKPSGTTGIYVGDNVVIGDGAVIEGPASIGAKGGVATSIGANALIDGAIIAPGAFVGTLARVGPGVTVPTGYRVLAGANVTTNAEASTPSLGFVVKVVSTDNFAANATKEIANSSALALGYSTLYQGNSADGGPVNAGPIPAPISAAGSTIFFGELNTVLGVSSEPGSTRGVPFEPVSGTPTFLSAGLQSPIAINLAYAYPARVIGAVSFAHQSASEVEATLGGVSKVSLYQGATLTTGGVTIRADEGQPIAIGSVASLGKGVSDPLAAWRGPGHDHDDGRHLDHRHRDGHDHENHHRHDGHHDRGDHRHGGHVDDDHHRHQRCGTRHHRHRHHDDCHEVDQPRRDHDWPVFHRRQRRRDPGQPDLDHHVWR